MPLRRKVKNKSFVIHRDASCLSSNTSHQSSAQQQQQQQQQQQLLLPPRFATFSAARLRKNHQTSFLVNALQQARFSLANSDVGDQQSDLQDLDADPSHITDQFQPQSLYSNEPRYDNFDEPSASGQYNQDLDNSSFPQDLEDQPSNYDIQEDQSSRYNEDQPDHYDNDNDNDDDLYDNQYYNRYDQNDDEEPQDYHMAQINDQVENSQLDQSQALSQIYDSQISGSRFGVEQPEASEYLDQAYEDSAVTSDLEAEAEDDHTDVSHNRHHNQRLNTRTATMANRSSMGMEECSLMNHSIDESYNAEAAALANQSQFQYDDEATDSELQQEEDDQVSTPRRREDSASPQEEDDDDVFSERSMHSSVGSYGSAEQRKGAAAYVEESTDMDAEVSGGSRTDGSAYDNTMSHMAHPARISEVTEEISVSVMDQDSSSGSSSRRTPLSQFRSVSALRKVDSPTNSIRSVSGMRKLDSPSGSVRSSKRSASKTAVTRLASPSLPVPYAPKIRTPSRLRLQPEPAPLVLLHVTMLPLQWSWAPVLEEAAAYAAEGNAILSEPIKNLRDAWSILQDRMGDTVLERGVLLPHPQNDYEILEERILEAMELPLRRRARILECGHYLGPANVMSLSDDEDSDDYDRERGSSGSYSSYETQRRRITATRHWCATCRHEIKVDALGPGKIFRVKVYASNGLMRAGAWEACWREMERIDIEIEPIVDTPLHIELAELAIDQQRRAEDAAAAAAAAKLLRDKEEAETDMQSRGIVAKIDDQTRRMNEERREHERRLQRERERELEMEREMERRREEAMQLQPKAIESPPAVIPIEVAPQSSSVPSSPSTSSYGRGSFRASSPIGNGSFDGSGLQMGSSSTSGMAPSTRFIPDTFPELLVEALRVFIRDRKNVVIGILSFLALLLAIRGGGSGSGAQTAAQQQHDHFPGRGAAYEHVPYGGAVPPVQQGQYAAQMQYQNVPQMQYQQAQGQYAAAAAAGAGAGYVAGQQGGNYHHAQVHSQVPYQHQHQHQHQQQQQQQPPHQQYMPQHQQQPPHQHMQYRDAPPPAPATASAESLSASPYTVSASSEESAVLASDAAGSEVVVADEASLMMMIP